MATGANKYQPSAVPSSSIKPEITVADLEIDQQQAAVSHLSLEVGDSFLSIAILDVQKKEYLAAEKFKIENASGSFNSDKLFQSINYLNLDYKTASATFYSNQFTLIPSALYQEEEKARLLQLNHRPDSNIDEVRADYLQNLDGYNVYSLQNVEATEKVLKDKFPRMKAMHFATPFIESLIINNKNATGTTVHLNITESNFQVGVMDGRKLVLFNTFEYSSHEDIVYYLLYTCEQLDINPSNMPLMLTGKVAEGDALFQLLVSYVKKINFSARPSYFRYVKAMEEGAAHSFHTLLNQYLCA